MKMTVWLGVMTKQSVSTLSSSVLHPCLKMVEPLFVKESISLLASNVWGVLAKTTVAAPAGGAAAAAGAAFCNATISA